MKLRIRYPQENVKTGATLSGLAAIVLGLIGLAALLWLNLSKHTGPGQAGGSPAGLAAGLPTTLEGGVAGLERSPAQNPPSVSNPAGSSARIAGRLIFPADWTPRAGALVELRSGDGRALAEATADVVGAFTFEAAPTGAALELCLRDPWLYSPRCLPVVWDPQQVSLPVRLGARLHVELQLPVGVPTGAAPAVSLVPMQAEVTEGARPVAGLQGLGAIGSGVELGPIPTDMTYRLSIACQGTAPVEVHGIRLAPGEERRLVVWLEQGASVRLRVEDPDGRPVDGARLLLRPLGNSTALAGNSGLSGKSDSQGQALFTDLEARTYTIQASAAGYLPLSGIEVLATQDPGGQVQTLVLERGLSLAGTVRFSSGVPAGASAVEAFRHVQHPGQRSVHRVPSGTVHCDGQGRFAIQGLSPGTYDLLAKTESESVMLSDIQAPAAQLEMRLDQSGSLIAQVLDSRGQAATEFEVCLAPCLKGPTGLERQGALERRQQVRDPSGKFQLSGLQEGPWSLDVLAPRGEVLIGEILEISGESAVMLQLAAAGRLAGRVLEPSGSAAVGARVIVESRRLEFFAREWLMVGSRRQVLAGADGGFSFDDLISGAICCWAEAADRVASPRIVIDPLPAKGLTNLELVLQAGAAIEGQVWLGGIPARLGTLVTATQWGEDLLQVATRTDAGGGFVFDALPPGDWALEVKLPIGPEGNERTLQEQVHVDDGQRASVELSWTEADPVRLVVDIVPSAAELRLEIVGVEGPSAGFRATAQCEGPGVYTLDLPGPGGYKALAELKEPKSERLERLFRVPTGREFALTLALPTGRIEGLAVDRHGKPLADVRIAWTRLDERDDQATLLPPRSAGGSDEHGVFGLGPLPFGSYQVFGELTRAGAPVERTLSAVVRLELDRPLAKVQLEFGAGQALEVQLLDSLGKAVTTGTVQLRPATGQWLSPGLSGSVDGLGRWSSDALSAGRYWVSAQSGDLAFESRQIELVADEHAQRIELTGRLGGVLLLLMGNGAPSTGELANVRILDAQGHPCCPAAESTLSGEAGVLRIGPLVPGEYTLEVRNSGREPLRTAATVVAGQQQSIQLDFGHE